MTDAATGGARPVDSHPQFAVTVPPRPSRRRKNEISASHEAVIRGRRMIYSGGRRCHPGGPIIIRVRAFP
ncbi:hypothetical protein [Candidatus Protofrankia datiscae]|uniref:hypothetical protein n=1 Tax=Candidatus Protofrankia datiscae TaxID=2716812 RepID=UPI001040F370|nr:hypothetical protein [Candidatus Protofrankia datiscae]